MNNEELQHRPEITEGINSSDDFGSKLYQEVNNLQRTAASAVKIPNDSASNATVNALPKLEFEDKKASMNDYNMRPNSEANSMPNNEKDWKENKESQEKKDYADKDLKQSDKSQKEAEWKSKEAEKMKNVAEKNADEAKAIEQKSKDKGDIRDAGHTNEMSQRDLEKFQAAKELLGREMIRLNSQTISNEDYHRLPAAQRAALKEFSLVRPAQEGFHRLPETSAEWDELNPAQRAVAKRLVANLGLNANNNSPDRRPGR